MTIQISAKVNDSNKSAVAHKFLLLYYLSDDLCPLVLNKISYETSVTKTKHYNNT